MEEAVVNANGGDDMIRVKVADNAVSNMPNSAVVNALQMTVHGSTQNQFGDTLVVVDDGPADHSRDDLTLYRENTDGTSGTATIGPANPQPFLNVFDGIERVDFVDGSGNPINANPPIPTVPGQSVSAATTNDSRLVVFHQDTNESNNDHLNATPLGGASAISTSGVIDPGAITNPFGDGQNLPGDSDWYQVEAGVTGTLDFQALFQGIGKHPRQWSPRLAELWQSGHPGVRRQLGNLIAAKTGIMGTPLSETAASASSIRIPLRRRRMKGFVIPAVQGQIYYVQSFWLHDGDRQRH